MRHTFPIITVLTAAAWPELACLAYRRTAALLGDSRAMVEHTAAMGLNFTA